MKIAWLTTIAVAVSTTNGLPLFSDDFTQNIINIKDYFLSTSDVAITQDQYNALPVIETEALQSLVNEDGLRHRAEALYDIAKSSSRLYGHPTRVIDSPGHWGTVHYILNELRKLNGYYKVSTQDFEAIDGRVKSYSLLVDGVTPKSLDALQLTPPTNGLVHAPLVLVQNEGCDLADFPANVTGGIALIKRGTCGFGVKSQLAGQKGALGAIIYNNEPGSLHGTLGTPNGEEVPSVSVSQEDGDAFVQALLHGKTLEATLFIDSYVKVITTTNVIAETVFGDHDNVVMLGGHSDSVTAGPGINDDGSGTISLLEVAKYLSKFKVNNAVRFAWWAAEEEGLLGSDYYVSVLQPEENQKIRLFMDYDMMASPNYAYQIYDANNIDNPNGSGDLKDLYIDWYVSHGLNYTLTPFDGRSDYDGFIKNQIPGGGIATGAEGIKTLEEQLMFGGKAGDWYDPCYHQLCDDLTNPDYEAWVINTKLIAHSVAVYAETFKGFPARELSEESMDIESIGKSKTAFKYHGPQLVL